MVKLPTVTDDIEVQVSMKCDFSETFYRDQFDEKTVFKSEFYNLGNHLCKLQSHNYFYFLFYFDYFTQMARLRNSIV